MENVREAYHSARPLEGDGVLPQVYSPVQSCYQDDMLQSLHNAQAHVSQAAALSDTNHPDFPRACKAFVFAHASWNDAGWILSPFLCREYMRKEQGSIKSGDEISGIPL